MKLASKTILLLTAIVSTVMVSVGFLLLHYQEESFKRSISDGLEGQTRMAAFGIENVIGEGLKEARAIAASFPARAFQMEDIAQVESYLQRMFETNSIFGNGFFILGMNGGFFADYPSHPQLRGASFADREYYQRAIQEDKGVISKPYRSRRTGQLVLTFTTLIRNEQGQAVAILGCSLDLLSKQVLVLLWGAE